MSDPINTDSNPMPAEEEFFSALPQSPEQIAAIRSGQNPRASVPEERIPGYEFLSRLGKGGMGEVWLVNDIRRDQLVAIKQILHAEASESELQRFRTEAHAMARMRHPGIAAIHHIDDHEGQPYFVMEYCSGGTLAEYLGHKPQPSMTCAAIAEAIAAAVQHAHDADIVHRDLKPGNVLIARRVIRDGGLASSSSSSPPTGSSGSRRNDEPVSLTMDLLKITDFGLARKLDTEDGMTRTQAVMGTPSYMAPEQATSARRAGRGADIWAIGVMLYEMITGGLPFVGADSVEVIDNLRHKEAVAPSEKVAVPRDLETICLKCLRKDPADRYASAGELAADLRAFQEGRGISARPMSSAERAVRWVRRNPSWAGLVSAVALSLMLGTGVSTWQAILASNAEMEAKKERAKAIVEAARADEEAARAVKGEKDAEDRRKAAVKLAGELDAALGTVRTAAKENERQLAFSRMQVADGLFAKGEPALARQTLDLVPPEHRAWEWHYRQRQYDGSFMTLFAHSRGVRCIAVSPDGRRIASGGLDAAIRIWDANTGQFLVQCLGHEEWINCLAFHPDGSELVSGGRDGTVRVWDSVNGHEKLRISGDEGAIFAVSFSPDRRRILSGGSDGTVRLWDRRGVLMAELKGHKGSINSVSFSPDGKRIASWGYDGSFRVWDATTGQALVSEKTEYSKEGEHGVFSPDGANVIEAETFGCLRVRNAKSGKIVIEYPDLSSHRGFSVSSDGTRLASGRDNSIVIRDAKTGVTLLELRGHTESVNAVCFTPDGQKLISCGSDGTVRIWDALGGSIDRLLSIGEVFWAVPVAFNPDGRKFASVEPEGIMIRNLKSGKELLKLSETLHPFCVDWSLSDDRIVAGYQGGMIRVYNGNGGQLLWQSFGHGTQVRGVCFSPDGLKIASVGNDQRLKIWEAATGKLVKSVDRWGDLDAVAFSPDGRTIASGGFKGGISFNDAQSGDHAGELSEGFGDSATLNIAYSANGRTIAAASTDKLIRVWDAKTKRLLHELRGHTEAVVSVGFSPDSQRIISSGSDGMLRVWDVKTGQSLLELNNLWKRQVGRFSPDGRTIVSTGDGILCIREIGITRFAEAIENDTFFVGAAFSPDSRKIATVNGHRLQIRNVKTGQTEVEIKDDSANGKCLAFRSDGMRIVTGCNDGVIRIRSATTGDCVLELKGHRGSIMSVSFSPDGRAIASVGSDDEVRVWDAESGKVLLNVPRGSLLNRVRFLPDSRRIALGWHGENARVWDFETAREERPIAPERDPPEDWLASPDRRWRVQMRRIGVFLMPLAASTPEELQFRLHMTRTDPEVARKQADLARSRKDPFAETIQRCVVAGCDTATADDWEKARAACEKTENYSPLLGACDLVLQRDPNFTPAYWYRALSLSARSRPSDALGSLLQALLIPSRSLGGFPNDATRAATNKQFALAALWEPNNPDHLSCLAGWALQNGDEEGYRTACGVLSQRFATLDRLKTPVEVSVILSNGLAPISVLRPASGFLAERAFEYFRAINVGNLVWAAALTDRSGLDAKALRPLAEEAARASADDWSPLENLGAICYRAGDYADAIRHLEKAAALNGSPTNWQSLFLAMAYHRLGKADRAKEWLGKSVKPTDKDDWQEHLIYDRLHKEAGALLGLKPQP